jgi:hypothetical protein
MMQLTFSTNLPLVALRRFFSLVRLSGSLLPMYCTQDPPHMVNIHTHALVASEGLPAGRNAPRCDSVQFTETKRAGRVAVERAGRVAVERTGRVAVERAGRVAVERAGRVAVEMSVCDIDIRANKLLKAAESKPWRHRNSAVCNRSRR